MAGIGDKLVDVALTNGGFTWKPRKGVDGGEFYNSLLGGYGVSVPGHEFVIETWHNPSVIAGFVNMYIVTHRRSLLLSEYWMGGWESDGKLYLDLSVIITCEGPAIQAAVTWEQLAYYDFVKGVSVNVNFENEPLE